MIVLLQDLLVMNYVIAADVIIIANQQLAEKLFHRLLKEIHKHLSQRLMLLEIQG